MPTLYCSPASPFGRIARIRLRELGLEDHIEEVMVQLRTPDNAILAVNPTGKAPTLVLDDGTVLSETRIVCDHLDSMSGSRAPGSDPSTRELEGIANGMLDGLAVWIREVRRPPDERSPSIIEQERARARRCLDYLGERADRLDDAASLANLMVAVSLEVAERRLLVEWREGRDALAAWYDRFACRPAFVATAPPDH